MRSPLAILSMISILILSCNSSASSILEPYYLQRGIDSSRATTDSQGVDHIDPFTGSVQLMQTDLSVPGEGGMSISINRNYRSLARPNSQATFRGERSPLGVGWIMHFGRVITPAGAPLCNTAQGDSNASNNSVWELGDGSAAALLPATSEWGYSLITKNLWVAECLQNGGYVVIAPDGTRYFADHYVVKDNKKFFYVTRIENKSGHHLEIEYGKSGNNGTGDNTIDPAFPLDDTSKNGYRDLIKNVKAYGYGSTRVVNEIEFYYYDINSWHARLAYIRFDSKRYVEYDYDHNFGYHYLLKEVRQQNSGNSDLVWDYEYELDPTTDGYLSLIEYDTPGNASIKFGYQSVDFRSGTTNLFETIAIDKRTLSTSGSVQEVGTWNYNFNQTSSNDYTSILLPSGDKIEYVHVGSDNYASGDIWNVGSLKEVRYYDGTSTITRKDIFTWEQGQKLSTQDEFHLYRATKGNEDHWSKRLVEKTIELDGTAYTTTYSNFDNFNNPQRIEENGNKTRNRNVTYFNDINFWVIGLTADENFDNEVDISRDYYDGGFLKSETRFGVTTQYRYYSSSSSARGLLKEIDGPLLEDTITYSDYYRGIPRTETYPESTSISRTIDGDTGDILSITNQRGRQTIYGYDRYGVMTNITTPKSSDDDITVDTIYSTSGKRVTVTRGDFKEISLYDGLGRLIRTMKEYPGEKTIQKDYEYDALGRLTYESDEYYTGQSHQGRDYRYDVLDRLERVTYTADDFKIEYDYLSSNKTRISKFGDSTQTVTKSYRSFGDPSEKYLTRINQSGTSSGSSVTITTDIGRDIFGNITSVTQGGLTRTYKLDSRKFIDYIDNPETGRTDLYFDDAGNLKTEKVGAAKAISYSYNKLNQLTHINYPDGTPDIDYDYYSDGSLKTVKAVYSGTTLNQWDYNWDSNNNLDYERLSIDGQVYEFDYIYNGLDHLSRIEYPTIQNDSLAVSYSPDGFGRPTRVGSWVSDIVYAADGAIERTEYSNGYVNRFRRDNRQHPDLWQSLRSGIAAMEYDYQFDDLGNLKKISGDSANWNFGYDSFNRLTHMNGNTVVRYDQRGNITYKNLNGKTINYNYSSSTDKLSSVSGSVSKSFNYDDFGNITFNGTHQFAYDNASNLISVNNQQLYQYDGHKRRVKTSEGSNTTISAYTNDGQLRMELKPNGDAVQYIYLANQLVVKRDLEGQNPPPAPTGLQISAGEDFLTVSWDKIVHNPEVLYYTVKYKKSTDTDFKSILVSDMTSVKLPDLPRGSQYLIKISATNSVGEGVDSNELSASPSLDPVKNFRVNIQYDDAYDYLNFSWDAHPKATGYKLCKKTVEPEFRISCIDVGNTTAYIHKTGTYMLGGPTVDYWVHAYDDLSGGRNSDVIRIYPNGPDKTDADVAIALELVSKYNDSSKQYSFSAVVENIDPDTAKNVSLELRYPVDSTLSVVSITPSQGTCHPNGQSCSFGDIEVGATVTVAIVVEKAEKGDKDHTATVTTTSNDLNPGNNTTTAKFGGSLGWLLLLIFGSLAYARRYAQGGLA